MKNLQSVQDSNDFASSKFLFKGETPSKAPAKKLTSQQKLDAITNEEGDEALNDAQVKFKAKYDKAKREWRSQDEERSWFQRNDMLLDANGTPQPRAQKPAGKPRKGSLGSIITGVVDDWRNN